MFSGIACTELVYKNLSTLFSNDISTIFFVPFTFTLYIFSLISPDISIIPAVCITITLSNFSFSLKRGSKLVLSTIFPTIYSMFFAIIKFSLFKTNPLIYVFFNFIKYLIIVLPKCPFAPVIIYNFFKLSPPKIIDNMLFIFIIYSII